MHHAVKTYGNVEVFLTTRFTLGFFCSVSPLDRRADASRAGKNAVEYRRAFNPRGDSNPGRPERSLSSY
jgi:hypothetical protein